MTINSQQNLHTRSNTVHVLFLEHLKAFRGAFQPVFRFSMNFRVSETSHLTREPVVNQKRPLQAEVNL